MLPQSDSDTDSVSSASSSDNEPNHPAQPQQQWETFDDLDTHPLDRPPLPPPRSDSLDVPHEERKKSDTPVDLPVVSPQGTNPFLNFDYEADETQIQSELSFNLIESDLDQGNRSDYLANSSPFESLHLSARPQSPFDDFSSSVGQALLNNSQRMNSNDPLAANTLANAGQQLAKIEEANENGVILANAAALDSEPKLSEPLLPTTTTTSAVPTQDALTELSRSTVLVKKDGGTNLSSAVASAHTFHPSYSTPNFHLHSSGTYPNYAPHTNPFYTCGYQHLTYDSKHLKRPSGPRSPKYAQEIPLSIPQVPLNTQKNKKPPPPKPEPYSRPRPEAKTDKDDPLMQRLPSIGEFNFDGLLGDGGMEGYVKPSSS